VADSVTVEGVDAAARAYAAIAADARNLTDANRAIAAAGADAARSRAPRRTGALSGSITPDATPTAAELRVGVAYWPFQEFGTRYVAARHYMAAGADAMETAANREYPARMARIIEAHT
jgi:HK97 gp10 family phage protein